MGEEGCDLAAVEVVGLLFGDEFGSLLSRFSVVTCTEEDEEAAGDDSLKFGRTTG